ADLGGLKVREAAAQVTYSGGILSLENLTGKFAPDEKSPDGETPGGFRGKGRAQLASLGEMTAELVLDNVPLGGLVKLAGIESPGPDESGEPVEGRASASVTARVDLEKADRPEAWEVDGKITVPLAKVYGVALEEGTAGLQVKAGVLSITG